MLQVQAEQSRVEDYLRLSRSEPIETHIGQKQDKPEKGIAELSLAELSHAYVKHEPSRFIYSSRVELIKHEPRISLGRTKQNIEPR